MYNNMKNFFKQPEKFIACGIYCFILVLVFMPLCNYFSADKISNYYAFFTWLLATIVGSLTKEAKDTDKKADELVKQPKSINFRLRWVALVLVVLLVIGLAARLHVLDIVGMLKSLVFSSLTAWLLYLIFEG